MLLSRSQLAVWEARARQRLWPYRLGLLAGCVLVNVAPLMTLAPPIGRVALLTWFAGLQAVALACSIAFRDRAWLPLAAVILVAMFELAQDGSVLLRVIDGSQTPSVVIAVTATTFLATIAASDGAAGPARRGSE